MTEQVIDCPFQEPPCLNGIINHLFTRCRGNIALKGIVEITSKSVIQDPEFPDYDIMSESDRYSVTNLGDPNGGAFISDVGWDEWICWNFGEMRIRPTHFFLPNSNVSPAILEGLTVDLNWIELGRATFCSSIVSVSNPFECFRIRLTSPGCCRIRIGSFEIFGSLIIPESVRIPTSGRQTKC
jgi:hypothetical protein